MPLPQLGSVAYANQKLFFNFSFFVIVAEMVPSRLSLLSLVFSTRGGFTARGDGEGFGAGGQEDLCKTMSFIREKEWPGLACSEVLHYPAL